jgi:hypothetical protein
LAAKFEKFREEKAIARYIIMKLKFESSPNRVRIEFAYIISFTDKVYLLRFYLLFILEKRAAVKYLVSYQPYTISLVEKKRLLTSSDRPFPIVLSS